MAGLSNAEGLHCNSVMQLSVVVIVGGGAAVLSGNMPRGSREKRVLELQTPMHVNKCAVAALLCTNSQFYKITTSSIILV